MSVAPYYVSKGRVHFSTVEKVGLVGIAESVDNKGCGASSYRRKGGQCRWRVRQGSKVGKTQKRGKFGNMAWK